jgi:hypothetical protein
MGYWWDDLAPEQRARLFRHFTPEQLLASLRARGLDVRCEDPDTLRAAARIVVAYERERAAETA